MTNKKALSVLLSKLSEAVSGLTDEDWLAIEQGRFDLRIEMRVRRDSAPANTANPANIETILRTLEASTTREEADAVLSAEGVRKDDLLAVARRLDLSVNRKDANEMIRQKIVENAVGFRIRSRSVQGTDPSHS